ncbi:MAG: parallel beta-helix domain-containing protein [Novosphingobium sp.]
MRMPAALIAAASALALAAPVHAKTLAVSGGEGAQARLQEALILAQPGDTVELAAGWYALSDGLSLDVPNVVVRGAGMDETILDFTEQKGGAQGFLVTSDDVTLRDFAVVNPKGDGIKSKGADNIVYYRVRVHWVGGPKTTNGAYGLYPVESTGVLIDGVKISGSSDAGIYVGQSKDITVRYSLVENNVAGIEIENSRDAVVTHNLVTRNTAGILVFDLPGLPVVGGGRTVVVNNTVVDNDVPNFAPKGNIVGSVPRGVGIMVMANEDVLVEGNTLANNSTAQVMVVSYPQKFEDKRYNPAPRRIAIGANTYIGGGDDPDIPGGAAIKAALGGRLPPVVWDGLGADAIVPGADFAALSLGLPAQGVSTEQAQPAPVAFKRGKLATPAIAGAPAALESRLQR